jgi:hypothetical protein
LVVRDKQPPAGRAADIIHRCSGIRIRRAGSARQRRGGTGGSAPGAAEMDVPLIDGVLQAAACRQGREHDVTNERLDCPLIAEIGRRWARRRRTKSKPRARAYRVRRKG